MFERVVCVNLRRRPERLKAFWNQIDLMEGGWPFTRPEIFEAVDGSVVPHPNDWAGGAGAWGCCESNRAVCREAIQDGIESLLVLEDDVEFHPKFRTLATDFMYHVPSDWDGIYFGCQHRTQPKLTGIPGIVRCQGMQRTHAYAVRGRWMRELYQMTFGWHTHIDHLMEAVATKYILYAPSPLLAFQSGGKSDIDFREYSAPRSWDEKPTDLIVYLKCPREVLEQLRKRGFHAGFSTGDDGVDLGMVAAMTRDDEKFRRYGLRRLLNILQDESATIFNGVTTLWYPQATLSDEQMFREIAEDKLVEITATTEAEAVDQFNGLKVARSAPVMV